MQQKLNFVDLLHNLEKKPDIDGVILESNSGNTKHNESFMSRAVMCGQSKQYNTILKIHGKSTIQLKRNTVSLLLYFQPAWQTLMCSLIPESESMFFFLLLSCLKPNQ